MILFSNWIFDRFPTRFKADDTYKDENNRGLLERFIGTLGSELDENIIPLIANYQEIWDPINTNEKFLTHISYFYGQPPQPYSYVDKYRRLLSKITEVNKIKGTAKSYVLFFKLIGLDVVVTETEPIDLRYDEEAQLHRYDDPALRYDMHCPKCSCYQLAISDPLDLYPQWGADPIEEEDYKLLMKLIAWVEPINARLCDITYNGSPLLLGGSYSRDYSFDYERIV